METLLTLGEAARAAGYKGEDTFRALLASGKGPPVVMVGKGQRVRSNDFRAWMESLPSMSSGRR